MQRTKDLLKKQNPKQLAKADLYQAVCWDIYDSLGADLVSIWKFDNELTQIECLNCLDGSTEEISQGQVLKRDDFPSYFRYIVEENVISAPDARNHFATKELTAPYFKPMGVISLLDFILQEHFNPIGVICCESRSKKINWTPKHKEYLRTIASLISFRFKIT